MKKQSNKVNNSSEKNQNQNHKKKPRSSIAKKFGISFNQPSFKKYFEQKNLTTLNNALQLQTKTLDKLKVPKVVESKNHHLVSKNNSNEQHHVNHHKQHLVLNKFDFSSSKPLFENALSNELVVKKPSPKKNVIKKPFTSDSQLQKKYSEPQEPSVEIADSKILKYMPEEKHDIKELLDSLKIKTTNVAIYEEALTHNSYSNEMQSTSNYQRLEFLGDSIINKIVSTFLYEMSDDDEGRMTKDRISIIQAKTLVRACVELNLHKYLNVGQGLIKNPISEKILEDIFESFIGAVYLDKGELKVKEILLRTILRYYLNDDLKNTIDYKTKFQEAVQKHGKNNNIIYRRVNNNPNDNFFEVELVWNNIVFGRGRGVKLHDAEVAAAKKACEKISKVNN